MRVFKTLLLTVLFFLAILFAVENNKVVDITFYGLSSSQLPLFIVVFISIFLGILIAGAVGALEGIRFRREINLLKKKIKEDEEELSSLRNLPLSDSEDSSQT